MQTAEIPGAIIQTKPVYETLANDSAASMYKPCAYKRVYGQYMPVKDIYINLATITPRFRDSNGEHCFLLFDYIRLRGLDYAKRMISQTQCTSLRDLPNCIF